MLILDGLTGFSVAAVLRADNAHASKGAAAILKRIIHCLKQAYQMATIVVRTDAGFAVPAIYNLLEREKVKCTIALISMTACANVPPTWCSRPKKSSQRVERGKACGRGDCLPHFANAVHGRPRTIMRIIVGDEA